MPFKVPLALHVFDDASNQIFLFPSVKPISKED